MNNVIYQKGQIMVTNRIFKTAKRTYKISHIERIHLKRSWFLFSLPLSLGSYALLNQYYDYLYQGEVMLCIFMMIVLPIVLFQIGTLSVTSKSYNNDTAITGWMPTLTQTRHALETVLYESERIVESEIFEQL